MNNIHDTNNNINGAAYDINIDYNISYNINNEEIVDFVPETKNGVVVGIKTFGHLSHLRVMVEEIDA